MSKVFVLDTNKQTLNPIHPGRARLLLSQGKAAVFRQYPFTIILKKEVSNPVVQPLRVKIDPGAKTTGLAIVNDNTGEVVWVAELQHRGFQLRDALTSRRQLRRSRRNRKTRYRKPHFLNRTRPPSWLPPSLNSRVANILTWVKRLSALCQITAISQELVRFDTQKMQQADISGVGYQQGTLAGYEIREFLLEKWHRTCAYCSARGTKLEIEHIKLKPLLIAAKGHGTRQACRTDKWGFPQRYCSRNKVHKGFQTGDIVKAIVTKGKKVGTYVGRVATRASGSFNISARNGLVQGINHKYCKFMHKKDGYSYAN
ncbi:RNA-guided endonuclease IscB [Coleofasciculus chthonoplastes]|uniref:RNA-guided endonuclease IscB n=1 Tax=Coleofasciculus chthonoplastes TaxID=64178 RepID=UPI00031F4091|nr:RNA-guided endonuclease IscB [Coleofasciculus chthonoplastes]